MTVAGISAPGRGAEKWLGSGYVLMVEPMELAMD